VALILGACLVSGATAVRLRNGMTDAPTEKANITVQFTSEDVKNAFEIVAFMKGFCKVSPGTPIPEGDFPTIDDFSPEALKTSPCGQDGESSMFDEASGPKTEQGLSLGEDPAMAVMKILIAKMVNIDKPDYAKSFKKIAGADTDISPEELNAWLDKQGPLPNKNDAVVRGDIFHKMFDFDATGKINATEFEMGAKKLVTENLVDAGKARLAKKGLAFMKHTKRTNKFTSKDIKNAVKIVAFMNSGCKRISPGTPLPEGDFPTMEDFNPEALKMSPCGRDGESKIFDTAADETGEQGLVATGNSAQNVLKALAGLLVGGNANKPDYAKGFKSIAKGKATFKASKLKDWLKKQQVPLPAKDDPTVQEKIFEDFDFDKNHEVNEAEFKNAAEAIHKIATAPPKQKTL